MKSVALYLACRNKEKSTSKTLLSSVTMLLMVNSSSLTKSRRLLCYELYTWRTAASSLEINSRKNDKLWREHNMQKQLSIVLVSLVQRVN